MERLQYVINEAFYQSHIFNEYFDRLKIGVFDIETTFIYPNKSSVILTGLLTPDTVENTLRIDQIFADSPQEEALLVEEILSDLSSYDVLVTYNGNRFDVPFVNTRAEALGFSQRIPPCQLFDLYRIVDRYSPLRDILPNLKQKSLEEFLELSDTRRDTISGKESINIYNKYCDTGDTSLKETVLLHNKDDVLQLSRLLTVLKRLDLHGALFHEGFTAAYENRRLFVKNMKLKKNTFTVKAISKNINVDYHGFLSSFHASHNKETGKFILEIPCYQEGGSIYFDIEPFDLNLSEDFLKTCPNIVSGYLIMSKNGNIFYRELNLIVKAILTSLLMKI